MDQGSPPALLLVSVSLLFTCPAARGSSASEEGKVLLTIFSTDDPSLPALVAELKTEDRVAVYYDSTLPTVQILVSGLEEYQQLFDELLLKNKDRTIASQRTLMGVLAALTNNSRPPNEIAELFLYSEKAVAFGETSILTCFVSGYFPPTITVTLQKNEEPLFSEVNSSRLSFGEDWRFQVLQYTEIQPAAGDVYSCKVVHTISKEQKIIYWAKQKVRATIFATSDDQTSLVVFATDDMIFAYYNDTFPSFKFLIKELDAFHAESTALVQKYRNDLRALNTDVLNEMADRIPKGQIDVPAVSLYPDNTVTLGERNVLNCFVYELFPPAVRVSFLKNDQPLSGQVNSWEFSFDDAWKFQILKYVEIEPADGDKYSCVVESGTNEQIIAEWEPEKPYDPYDSAQIAICTVGVVVGALGLTIGLLLLFYKRGNELGSESQRI